MIFHYYYHLYKSRILTIYLYIIDNNHMKFNIIKKYIAYIKWDLK